MYNGIHRCLDCCHCSESEKKCYPESCDCAKEYDLTDDDIYSYRDSRCDFYIGHNEC